MPDALLASVPDSVTEATSFAGTYTVAVVLGGTTIFQLNVAASRFQSLLIRPLMSHNGLSPRSRPPPFDGAQGR